MAITIHDLFFLKDLSGGSAVPAEDLLMMLYYYYRLSQTYVQTRNEIY